MSNQTNVGTGEPPVPTPELILQDWANQRGNRRAACSYTRTDPPGLGKPAWEQASRLFLHQNRSSRARRTSGGTGGRPVPTPELILQGWANQWGNRRAACSYTRTDPPGLGKPAWEQASRLFLHQNRSSRAGRTSVGTGEPPVPTPEPIPPSLHRNTVGLTALYIWGTGREARPTWY